MPTWTRVADPVADAPLLPAWFVGRMLDSPGGSFGLLLTTGDVLRVSSLIAAHLSSDGTTLLDVGLDHAGVPEDADIAWRSKHYLGSPVPGATLATVNLAHVVAAIDLAPDQDHERVREAAGAAEAAMSATVVELKQVAEEAMERRQAGEAA